MANQVPTQEKFNFAVDSALLGELGEKLVSTVHVALAELIKNAYDADARKVDVFITPETGCGPRIRIIDDGTGMTLEEVQRFWMKIGTPHKNVDRITPKYGRPKTGSKGIGRFACRRLGLNLKLTTCAQTQSPKTKAIRYQTTEIEFNWNDFEPGIDVESVLCDGHTSTTQTGTVGTTLEIWGGIVDEWQTRGFNYLQRQLPARFKTYS